MSKIFDLINELCPDGVEFRELQEICYTITSPIKLKANQYRKNGKIPIIDQGEEFIAGYCDCNSFINKGEYVIFGDHSEHIKFIDFAFVQGADGLKILVAKECILPKFLYYSFLNFYCRENNYKRHWSRAKETKLPVPPMEVQREIVRILDSFTLLTAELTAELTARKKQYEFYRDFLLSFDELDKNGGGCELKMLGEIAEIASGGTPSTHNKIFWENGTIPWLKSEVCKDCIIEKSSLFITESGLNNSSAKIFKQGTVLMAMVGATIFKMAFLNIEAATNQNIAGIKANNKILMDKFLFYFLVKSYPELISKLSGYNMANLTQVKKIKIPVPSLQTQQKVVDILDKFDTLVNSITEGLPREIELRRKQYEHYRELLLNFKPNESIKA